VKINQEKLEIAMAQKLMDKEQLAVRLKISRQALYHQVYKARAVRPSTVGRIARVLDVSVEELVGAA